MTSRANILPLPERRCLSHSQAAEYVGVGVAFFDRMVADGTMPGPLSYPGRRRVFDRRALDDAITAMPNGIGVDEGLPKWNFETETGLGR